ncbi:helix-turn-helix domain-containing protein [Roseibium alexandrii]|uniref:GcrA cell cycle regulator n=1 Tax=Roseibium alexandrii (strain DSM 17067 / NCIMB 14079 / DFL-11) TaxID=244592 RepID=A0A5E8H3X5_ROSAD|nr:response regulator transcription factor [Roseibium alexandrii]EEE46779.1 hypothetical protein SADFL11_4068 [Roseibium alexandrii DFL-11]
MSLAETFEPITWDALTVSQKREAVLDLLICGRNVPEIAEALSITYGTIGANHVRGVIDRHKLDDDRLVIDARQRRRTQERAASLARARARRPVALPKPAALPKMPLAPISGRKGGGVTLFDLKNGMCRAPLWNDSATGVETKFYCGAPVRTGQSYCAACCERLHAPARERIVFHTPAAANAAGGRQRAR